MQPTGKSLVLDLLSTLRGAALPVRALVAAGDLFGIAENSVRVELARLLGRGLVERNERGQYRLARGAQPVQSRVAAWRDADARTVAWRETWVAVSTARLPRSRRAALRKSERALGFLGFRHLEPALWVRPDNLAGSVGEVRRQLHALGLDADAPVFGLTDLDPAATARAHGLWDAAVLLADYRETRRAIERSENRLAKLAPEKAMAETFLLGGRAIRQLALDPLLPEPIVPAAERRALVEAMRRYDRIGRQCWRRFMRSHGAPSHESPANVHMPSPAAELAAAAGGRR